MQPLPIRSVLVATDLDESGDDVLRAGAGVAAAARAQLHVVHAFDLDLAAYPDLDGGVPTFQGRIAQAVERLDAQLRRTLPAGIEPASREVVIYLAHRAILERAAAVGADL
ncbi:MAG TPA: universal stress protein, partial [Longimicrobiaceae bacterium]|nr:universal stress protein [Longimicrobiaceae bacterium]